MLKAVTAAQLAEARVANCAEESQAGFDRIRALAQRFQDNHESLLREFQRHLRLDIDCVFQVFDYNDTVKALFEYK